MTPEENLKKMLMLAEDNFRKLQREKPQPNKVGIISTIIGTLFLIMPSTIISIPTILLVLYGWVLTGFFAWVIGLMILIYVLEYLSW